MEQRARRRSVRGCVEQVLAAAADAQVRAGARRVDVVAVGRLGRHNDRSRLRAATRGV